MAASTEPPTARPARLAVAGVAAATVGVASTELAIGVAGGRRSVLAAVADAVIVATPGPLVRFAIDTFGTANRLVLGASIVVVLAAAGSACAWLVRRRRTSARSGIVLVAAVACALLVADARLDSWIALGAPLIGAIAAILTLERLVAIADRSVDVAAEPPDERADDGNGGTDVPGLTRRRFITAIGLTGVGALVGGVAARGLQARVPLPRTDIIPKLPRPDEPLRPPAPSMSFDVDGLSPLITPTEDFYRIDTAYAVPRLDPADHAVEITGMVDRPYTLSYDDIVAMARTEADVTLSCVSNLVGGNLVGNARWLGVPLAEVLDAAGVQPGATQIVGRSWDGWTAGFPVEAAFDGRPALVAIGMNGRPLPARHGFPVRLVIAGLYGYVSDTKWLTEIQLTTFEDHQAYWIPRGWAREGPIKIQSRIDVPRRNTTIEAGATAVAGVAWSDERGLRGVEISVDEGAWQAAQLADELASTSWRQWLLHWQATPGEHTLAVRAIDANGVPQTAERAPPEPDGATGHHTIRVTVV